MASVMHAVPEQALLPAPAVKLRVRGLNSTFVGFANYARVLDWARAATAQTAAAR